MLVPAATNSREDLQLYSYEKSEAMPEGTALQLKEKLSDPALQSILMLHMGRPKDKQWIAEYQNHKDNLPDDPTQVVTDDLSSVLKIQPHAGAGLHVAAQEPGCPSPLQSSSR